MPSITDYLENKLIDWLFRGQSFTPPSSLYFALFISSPGEDSTGTEVSGNGYARVEIACSLTNFAGTQTTGSTDISSGTSGATSNNVEVEFPAPTGDWGSIAYLAVMDAATDGNILLYGALAKAKVISSGDPAPKFNAGKIVFTLDSLA